jgi:hypothetical protein
VAIKTIKEVDKETTTTPEVTEVAEEAVAEDKTTIRTINEADYSNMAEEEEGEVAYTLLRLTHRLTIEGLSSSRTTVGLQTKTSKTLVMKYPFRISFKHLLKIRCNPNLLPCSQPTINRVTHQVTQLLLFQASRLKWVAITIKEVIRQPHQHKEDIRLLHQHKEGFRLLHQQSHLQYSRSTSKHSKHRRETQTRFQ